MQKYETNRANTYLFRPEGMSGSTFETEYEIDDETRFNMRIPIFLQKNPHKVGLVRNVG